MRAQVEIINNDVFKLEPYVRLVFMVSLQGIKVFQLCDTYTQETNHPPTPLVPDRSFLYPEIPRNCRVREKLFWQNPCFRYYKLKPSVTINVLYFRYVFEP